MRNSATLTAKIYPLVLEIQSKLEAINRVPRRELARNAKSSALFKTWIKRLPLKCVPEFQDFNAMLLENPGVWTEIVI